MRTCVLVLAFVPQKATAVGWDEGGDSATRAEGRRTRGAVEGVARGARPGGRARTTRRPSDGER